MNLLQMQLTHTGRSVLISHPCSKESHLLSAELILLSAIWKPHYQQITVFSNITRPFRFRMNLQTQSNLRAMKDVQSLLIIS